MRGSSLRHWSSRAANRSPCRHLLRRDLIDGTSTAPPGPCRSPKPTTPARSRTRRHCVCASSALTSEISTDESAIAIMSSNSRSASTGCMSSGVKPSTVSAYRHRHQMPPPEQDAWHSRAELRKPRTEPGSGVMLPSRAMSPACCRAGRPSRLATSGSPLDDPYRSGDLQAGCCLALTPHRTDNLRACVPMDWHSGSGNNRRRASLSP